MHFVTVGHISLDNIVLRDGRRYVNMLGGTVTYASLTLKALGAGVKVISKVGGDFGDESIAELAKLGLDVGGIVLSNSPTTRFELIYSDKGRKVRLLARCDDISPKDAVGIQGMEVIAGPIAGELPEATLLNLLEWENVISMDIQGMVRSFDEKGNVRLKSMNEIPWLMGLLSEIYISKGSMEEWSSLLEERNEMKLLELLMGRGSRITLVTKGDEGAIALFREDGKALHVPAYPVEGVVDPTGAGDVFLAAFTLRYVEKNDGHDALAYASSASSFVVEDVGVANIASSHRVGKRAEELGDMVRRII